MGAEETIGFIDLASCMTAANRKQYHQVDVNGDPLAYRCVITAVKGGIILRSAMMGFITGNAVKMTAQGWLAQMKHANIKRSDLPKYGKRPRFALIEGAWVEDTTAIAGASITAISKRHLEPLYENAGTAYFPGPGYIASDGRRVTYRAPASPTLGIVCSNMIATVVVESEDEKPLVLLGSNASEFNVINEYREGRRSPADVDVSDSIPEGDMSNLFSVAEESSDEIEAGLEEYMDWTPYIPDQVTTSGYDELSECAHVDATTSATSQYPPNQAMFDAPLGLLQIEAAVDDVFFIDVEAIYEM